MVFRQTRRPPRPFVYKYLFIRKLVNRLQKNVFYLSMSRAYGKDTGDQSSALNNGIRKSASHGELYGLTCKVAIDRLEFVTL